MKKLSLSLAMCAALSLAAVPAMTSPADAKNHKASSKKSKSKAAKVEVSKKSGSPAPASVVYFNNCATTGASYGLAIGSVAAVGCGVVWAVPVLIQSFIFRG